MRQVEIDFTNNNCYENIFAGYTGEHNATEMLLVIFEEMINVSDYQVVVIQSGAKIFKSDNVTNDTNKPYYRSGNTIHMKLDKKLTRHTSLVIQVEFYKNNESGENVLIAKSSVAPNIYLKPSPKGETKIEDEYDETVLKNVVTVVKALPEKPEVDTIVALVSEDDNSSKTFYIATEISDGNIIWEPYVSEQGKMPEAYAYADTLDAGSDAYADAYYNDETDTYDFIFGIPKGDKGDKGDKGEKGEKGEDGKDGENGKAATINGENAFNFHAGYGLKLTKDGIYHILTRNSTQKREITGTTAKIELLPWHTTYLPQHVENLEISIFADNSSNDDMFETHLFFGALENCELVMPSNIKWAYGIPPQLKKEYLYYIHIKRWAVGEYIASFVEVSV